MSKHTVLYLLLAIAFIAILGFAYAASGDGVCDPGENSCTDPEDCGECSGDVPVNVLTCHYYACSAADACDVVRKVPCCPNNSCEESAGETFGTCPGDCLPSNLEFELIEMEEGEEFFRGERVLFKVKVTGDGKPLQGAELILSTPFGAVKLFNDGAHGDGTNFDAVYGNYFNVPMDAAKKDIVLNVTGEFRTVVTAQNFNMAVNPMFDVFLNTQPKYVQSSLIDLSGMVGKHGYMFAMPLNIKLFDGRETIFDFNTESNKDGNFLAEYKTSLIDRPGIWTVFIEGNGPNNNFVLFESEIEVIEPGSERFLVVEILTQIKDEYERGEELSLIVTVKDELDNPVDGASVKITGPLNENIMLVQLAQGQYSGAYKIPHDMPWGQQDLSISATKKMDGIIVSGNTSLKFIVGRTTINVEIVEPTGKHYQVGDNLSPGVFLSYASGEWVVNAEVEMLINNREVGLAPEKTGFFTTNYFVQEQDMGQAKVSFHVKDDAGNEGFAETFIEVSGFSLVYTLQRNIILVAGTIAALAMIGFSSRAIFVKRGRKGKLKRRKVQLEALEKELQKRYFKDGSVKKEEYEALMEKYETELQQIGKFLKEGKGNAGNNY